MSFAFLLMIGLFIFLCLFLILLILIQKGRGGGLASAFGGAGGNTAFGSKTGDVLTWATSIVFGIFLLLAIGLNLLANAQQARMTTPPPVPMPNVPPPTGLPPAVPGDEPRAQPEPPSGPTQVAPPADVPIETPAPPAQP